MSVHLEDSCVCVHQHVLQGACSRALRVWKRAQYLTSVFVCQKRFCIHVCVAHASGSAPHMTHVSVTNTDASMWP
jgi:hypothetical protein